MMADCGDKLVWLSGYTNYCPGMICAQGFGPGGPRLLGLLVVHGYNMLWVRDVGE